MDVTVTKFVLALCAAALVGLCCTQVEFDNPIDPDNQKPNTTTTARTITFDANGGIVEPTSDTTIAGGFLASLPTPTRNDHNFNGWFTAKAGGEAVGTTTQFPVNATIYAQWDITRHTITFDGQGVSLFPQSEITNDSGTLDSRLPEPTRKGYAFDGWFTEPAPNGIVGSYPTVRIGNRVWMAVNLNETTSDTRNSYCYGNSTTHCETYGRLYKLDAADRRGFCVAEKKFLC